MNNDIIGKLIREHREIISLLNAFKKGKGFEDTEWRDNLFKAKKLFTEHLKTEDEILYPALCTTASAEEIACKYRDEMKSISKQAMEFMEKYKEEHSGANFSPDYAALTSALQKRIDAEESELFPEFLRLKK